MHACRARRICRARRAGRREAGHPLPAVRGVICSSLAAHRGTARLAYDGTGMTIRRSFAVLPVCTLAFAMACGGDSSGPPAVATVDVTGSSTDLIVGQTAQLAATARDAKGNALTGRTVGWSTSSATVASVSTSGLVVGVAPGSATITATVDGKTGTRNVTVVPPPVATVAITATSTTIQAGATAQLTAVTLDANSNVLTGRSLVWATSDAAIATVSQTGQVAGVAEGVATITATAEGKTGSVQIAVTAPPPVNAPQVTTVTPNPLVEGQPATIGGTNFGTTVAGNIVRVGGVTASVTAASATSLQIVVPPLNCKPAQNVSVDVSVGGVVSAPKSQPFRPASVFTLAAGQQRRFTSASDFCLQFDASAANESYLIGVQSVSENVTSVTPASVTAEAPGGAVFAARERLATAPVFSASLVNPMESERAVAMAKHRAVAATFLQKDRELLASRMSSLRARARAMRRGSASVSSVPSVPVTAKVGDVLNVRVPDRSKTDICANFVAIAATVKTVGAHSIILADTANPTGGFSEADYQTLSDQFDNQIYATDVGYFGEPTDLDANSRVVIIVTKEVNKTSSVLGFVSTVDLVPQTECPTSNEGEVFYGKAPDPNGVVNGSYETADALADAPIIIAHEFTHVLQLGRRAYLVDEATAFQSTWELEGQATFAEEVNGFAALGLAPGQNLGFAVAFNTPESAPMYWFTDMFVDLLVYYGFETRSTRVPTAPEECSWLGTPGQGNTGPCLLGGREPYGVPASFFRWLSDQFGPGYPGGEKGIHRRLVDNAFTGYATVSDVIGQPIDVLLAQWAAALYVDDRVTGADPRLAFTSWNLTDIESGLVPTAHLTPRDRQFGAFTDQVSVRGGSTAYFLVSGAGRGATGIRVRNSVDDLLPGVMRLWVVRVR